jgi:predicted RNA-binding protein YlqC (UPF0109 family)
LPVPNLSADLTELVKLLVDRPEMVSVREDDSGQDILLELQVAPEDLGKVIGRHGRTARALRTLLETRGDRRGESYELEILEE